MNSSSIVWQAQLQISKTLDLPSSVCVRGRGGGPFCKISNSMSLMEMHDNIPKHIAIIVDGNRRWAKARGLSVQNGHKFLTPKS